mmetsp:Transcript_79272/g.229261  ORF Transcript_79272/g.229261 Transcript_79272/m.229261 type:complete len:315 (+) Transcript_79272:1532-2476(+)
MHRQALLFEAFGQSEADDALQFGQGRRLFGRCGLAGCLSRTVVRRGPAEGREALADGEECEGRLEHREDLAQRRHQFGVLILLASQHEELRHLEEALVVAVEQQPEELQAAGAAAVSLGEVLRQEVVPLLAQRMPQHGHQILANERCEQRLTSLVLFRCVVLRAQGHGRALQAWAACQAKQLLRVHVRDGLQTAHVLDQRLEHHPVEGLAPAGGLPLGPFAADLFRDNRQQPLQVRLWVPFVKPPDELAKVDQPRRQVCVGLVEEGPRGAARLRACPGEHVPHNVDRHVCATVRALDVRLDHVDVEADFHIFEH